MEKKGNQFIFFAAEFLSVFLISLTAVIIVFWRNYVSILHRQFTLYALKEFVIYALGVSFAFTLGYRSFGRFVLNYFLHLFSKGSSVTFTKKSFIWDVFLISVSVITFYPLNPVFQDTAASTYLPHFSIFSTRFDFIPTLVVLLVLAAFTTLVQLLLLKEKHNHFRMAAPFLIAFAMSFINYGPNYDARIFETREAWKLRDTDLMIERAHIAQEAARNDQDRSRAYYWLAVAYNLKEKPDSALKYINQAIVLYSKDGSLYSVRAFALVRLKRFEEALDSAKTCIELSADYAWCYVALARIYHDLGDILKAVSAQRKAALFDLDSPEIIEYLKYLEMLDKQ